MKRYAVKAEGALLKASLVSGVISGLGVGLLQPFAKASSRGSVVPGMQKRRSLIALTA